jgi:hypothetical protein
LEPVAIDFSKFVVTFEKSNHVFIKQHTAFEAVVFICDEIYRMQY